MENKLLKIGFILKAHGIKGEVFLKIFDKEDSYIKEGIKLVLDAKTYVVKKLRRASGGLIVKLIGVDTRNHSDLLKGFEVFVGKDVFKNSLKNKEVYLNQLKGFKIFLKEDLKGVVSGFSQTPAHDLLVVDLISGGVVEIPYVSSFIIEINNLEKTIKVNCPKDLFDEDFLSGAKK